MFPAYQIVQKAFDIYFNRDSIAYWMGAKGEVLTYERMDELIKWNQAYFDSHYSAAELERLKNWSVGKIGYDCSGLISHCVGVQGWSSWTLWEHCINTCGIKESKAGSILWRPGHIGLDLGFGACMHIGKEGQTIRIDDNISPVPAFTTAGQWEYADYSMMFNY